MILQTGDWTPYIPKGLSQLLRNGTMESDACTNYSAIDSIETQEYFLTGQRIQYSRRWAAFMAGTTKDGNYINVSWPSIFTHGLVLETSWPQDDSMSFNEFYAAPDPTKQAELVAEGQRWLQRIAPGDPLKYDIKPEGVPEALKVAPVIAIITSTDPIHVTEVINTTTIFDSEPHSSDLSKEFIAPLPTVHSYHQIILNLKENMSNSFFVYDETKNEFSIAEPKTNPDALISDALNCGLSLPMKPGVPETAPAQDRIDFDALKSIARKLQ